MISWHKELLYLPGLVLLAFYEEEDLGPISLASVNSNCLHLSATPAIVSEPTGLYPR